MPATKFFDERSDQSEVKSRIVQKYFYAWAKVIIPSAKKWEKRIGYIDMFAGPGRYKDGAASTPLLVLQKAIGDPDLSQMLVVMLNDRDSNHTATLQSEIDNLPGIEKLKYKPRVSCGEIDEDAERYFNETRLVPSFTFVDPFGYKALSLRIVNGVIKDWGCDCVFFFNYKRINAGINNKIVDQHINALFGDVRAAKLRKLLPSKTPALREMIILEELAQALKEMGGEYVLPFRFKSLSGNRTTHCLIFVTKNFRGYEIMKEIMAGESSTTDQGVPSLAYSRADESTPLLFSLARPLEALEGLLLEHFAGQTLTMKQVYERHNVDTRYIEKNYKDALTRLESAGKVVANPPAISRPKRKGTPTFADHVQVKFPGKRH